VEGQNIRVLKAGEQSNLSYETQLTRIRARIGVQNLDGDLSLKPAIVREVDGRERALTDLSLDLVADPPLSARFPCSPLNPITTSLT
jgi:hypothetical protein